METCGPEKRAAAVALAPAAAAIGGNDSVIAVPADASSVCGTAAVAAPTPLVGMATCVPGMGAAVVTPAAAADTADSDGDGAVLPAKDGSGRGMAGGSGGGGPLRSPALFMERGSIPAASADGGGGDGTAREGGDRGPLS